MIPDQIINSANALYIVTGEQLHAFGQQCANTAVAQAESVWQRTHDAMFEPLFDKKHVADIFGVDARTIDNWIDLGIIDPTKIGGVVRFDGEEIVRIKRIFKRKHKKINI